MIALYVHVPFCIRKCKYCNFFSIPFEDQLSQRYLRNLFKEIDFWREKLSEKVIKTIYIGGGTPTVYDEETLVLILRKIKESFNISENAEITVEANPKTINEKKLKGLKEEGVNRLSLGIQSLNDRLLKILGRPHSAQEAIEAMELVSKVNFKSWNVDLIYAIPTQTLDEWEKTLREVLSFSPPHLSLYSLILEEKTPLYEEIKSGLYELPEDEGYEAFTMAKNLLKEKNYIHYEISNFAIEGHFCQHNITYWKNEPYIGIGPGASSFYEGWRFKREENFDWFLGYSEVIRIDKEEEMKETIFMNLRMLEGIDKEGFFKRFGIRIEEKYKEIIEKLKKEGLLEEDQNRIKLTERGLLLGNQVFESFV
ncbi:MAG: radical SAM family heme chaperone HemW [Synergistetes bacterium]|nr:radical SAM family heme chaperone HemW [Synergistota bacterium]MCX8127197.1 radical SAM family heme chaperone HemW [Synergistota bacterium]MDW8191917.1 radical SAM family heme chaperone HemW [Synergistota bacterium]